MLMVKALAGCLAADTAIVVNRAGKGSTMSIEKVVKQFSGEPCYYYRSDNGARQAMRPWDRNILTKVACAVDGSIVSRELKNAWFSGKKQTYELTTESGRCVRATDQHPFLTDNGWLALADISVNMSVAVNCGKGGSTRKPKMNYQYILTRFHPYQINNGANYKVATHRLVVEAAMNNLELPDYVDYLRNNPAKCASFSYLEPTEIVHHVDGNHTNNVLTNLEVLSDTKEHSDNHDWGFNVLARVGYERVISISKYRVEDTYDLELATDPHNFLANGFVVHNTGKTTTALWGLGVAVPRGIKVSQEQSDIITLMRSFKWDTCCAQAFNVSIAKELERRVPEGVEAATSNAFGWRAWKAWCETKKLKPKIEEYKSSLIFKELVGTSMPWKERLEIDVNMSKLISLCKCNLVEPTDAGLAQLADYYDIDLTPAIIDYTKQVWELSINSFEMLDFNDQNFMPIFHNIELPQFDAVVVDELQDLNAAKQEMAFRSLRKGGAFIGIGDEHQAIYGFSGADAESMNNVYSRMQDISESASLLPLTVTRRCPKAVVAEANKYVKELKAHKDAPDGEVSRIPEGRVVESLYSQDFDAMVLCRTNAPLTSLAFKLIAEHRRCYIQGRDIGRGLKREITKHDTNDLKTALSLAIASIQKRIDKELKGFAKPSKIEGYEDKITCLSILCSKVGTVKEFENAVDSLFRDKGSPGDHQLSTVHKAKGLEHKNVIILKPKKLPMIFKKKAGKKGIPVFQVQQEYNLTYVAYTRSMDKLTFATEEDSKDDLDISEFMPEEADPEYVE